MTRLSSRELEKLTASSQIKIRAISSKKYSAGSQKKQPHPWLKRSVLEVEFEQRIKLMKFPEPVCEYRFHDVRNWRLDFYWPDFKLAVEIDGGTRNHGQIVKVGPRAGQKAVSGHLTPDGFQKDCEKQNSAVIAGISILRADSDMVTKGMIYQHLESALRARGWN